MIFWCQSCGEQHTQPHVTSANITTCAKCGGSHFATWKPVQNQSLSQEAVRDEVLVALRELVELKDMKDRDVVFDGDRYQEYARRKPLAWAAARAALKREPNAAAQAGQDASPTPSQEGHAAGPAPAAPDVASMVKRLREGVTVLDEPFHRQAIADTMEEAAALLARLGQPDLSVSCPECAGGVIHADNCPMLLPHKPGASDD